MSAAGERTEEATPRRRASVLAQGIRAHSALALTACALPTAVVLWWLLQRQVPAFEEMLRLAAWAAAGARHATSVSPLIGLCQNIIHASGLGTIVTLSVCSSTIAAVVAAAACGPLGISMQALVPRWSRIAPRQAGARLMSLETVSRACASGLGVFIIAALLLPPIARALETLATTPDVTSQAATALATARHLLALTCATLAGLAAFDVAVQRRRQAVRIKMTPREVKDERAQHEGRPDVRQRRRAIGAKRARGLRIAAIRRATAVIANPTHLAIALRYAPPALEVPTVVARGTDRMAGVLKDVARSFEVPVIEAPELARELYDRTDIDEPIPEECYEAVAAIFTWILRVHGRLRRGDEDDA